MSNPTSVCQKKFSVFKSENFYFDHISFKEPPNFPFHTHDICELIFIKKGNISYIVDGKTYPLARHCLVITHPGESHAIKVNDNTEYERYDFLLDEKELPSNIYNSIPNNISVINFEGNTLILDIFQKANYYCENFEGAKLKNILLHLMEEVLYNVVLASKNLDLNGVYTVNPMINKAIAYIEKNITTAIDIDSICKELYITKSHLHHLFIKYLEISPKKYIISKKLLISQRELRVGKKPTEVYLACGFSDYSTFYRDYKKYFGHSPSDEINTKIIRKIQS